ncbi:hypothetical protein [Enterobacter asburiae]|uniref:hypothetical protein n=1 Tax=Enterobacter asburiae TaxID=61645 RepID=UPI0021D38ED2|nr:hypothetical protein [Enterobacter asburiae]MCU6244024.1 hypothetical protein [Enterobacter asburiae]
MYNVSISSILRILASGLNPDTGLPLPDSLCVHSKTYQNYLKRLANELENIDTPPPKKNHPNRWTAEEQQQLSDEWLNHKFSLEKIAEIHSRSELAIALRLVITGIDEEGEVLPHLSKSDQTIAEITLQERENKA